MGYPSRPKDSLKDLENFRHNVWTDILSIYNSVSMQRIHQDLDLLPICKHMKWKSRNLSILQRHCGQSFILQNPR